MEIATMLGEPRVPGSDQQSTSRKAAALFVYPIQREPINAPVVRYTLRWELNGVRDVRADLGRRETFRIGTRCNRTDERPELCTCRKLGQRKKEPVKSVMGRDPSDIWRELIEVVVVEERRSEQRQCADGRRKACDRERIRSGEKGGRLSVTD